MPRPLSAPPLRGIFFSEFHHVTGPMLTWQVPDGYISQEVFEALSEYIITKPQLCHKPVAIVAQGHKIMGFPISIENKKYKRNVLQFNICFVFKTDADACAYELAVRKTARYLQALELECEFIFKPETKPQIQEILTTIFDGLNANGECIIPVNDANTMYLKLFPARFTPSPVRDHEVPFPVRLLDSFAIDKWDLSMQQILPFVDGVNHVKKIATKADMDISIVRRCVEHFVYYGIVKMIDIFQYSSVYTVTGLITQLVNEEDADSRDGRTLAEVRKECVAFVTRNGSPSPPFETVFALYCRLRSDQPYREFCMESSLPSLGIDERRFVQYGLISGFLRCIHPYPVRLALPSASADTGAVLPKIVRRMLDGTKSYNEICCAANESHESLDRMLREDPQTVVIFK
eukprot:Opistho-2@88196